MLERIGHHIRATGGPASARQAEMLGEWASCAFWRCQVTRAGASVHAGDGDVMSGKWSWLVVRARRLAAGLFLKLTRGGGAEGSGADTWWGD